MGRTKPIYEHGLTEREIFSIVKNYSEVAWVKAELADCSKKQVGAVLVGFDNFGNAAQIFCGYGGPVVDSSECKQNKDGLCPRKYMDWAQDGCWSMHAEERAIMNALANGKSSLAIHNNPKLFDLFHTSIEKWVMIVTHGPCDQCIKFMVSVGIETCVYDVSYKTDYSKWTGYISIVPLRRLRDELAKIH